MSFRNRPVLDRRHRPRWQDELRTQQLVVAGFAAAIAVALGIFGATAWNGYWESHLRPVATVDDVGFDRADLTARERALGAELIAEAVDIQAQLGGARDPVLEQRLQEINTQLSSLTQDATESLVQGAVLSQAEALDLSVPDDEIDAEIAERAQIPERRRLALILVEAEPEPTPSPTPSPTPGPAARPDGVASPGVTTAPEAAPSPTPSASPEPSEEDFVRAEAEAQAALERLEAGEEVAAVAAEVSDDFTGQSGGGLGLVEADDAAYGEYYDAVTGLETDEVAGPLRTERGYALVQLLESVPAGPDEALNEQLSAAGVPESAYRAYIRDELLASKAQAYFEEEIAVSPQPQRLIAQIYIAAEQGTPVPQRRARHVLIQPLPGEPDQAAATDEQWAAALAEAEDVREQLAAPEADWLALAAEHSQDPGSRANGGDLGWFDPATSGFVVEFTAALAALEPGEISEPVRTQFGYHIIQITDERTSAAAQAAEVLDEVRGAPGAFGEVAARVSEDPDTAQQGGELGWIARYQLTPELEEVVFGLDEVGDVSEVVVVPGDGYYILKLLEVADSREVEDDRLEQIRSAGLERWLAEIREAAEIWVDPQFASSDLTES